MVGGDAVHVDGLLGYAAKEVAAADDDADLAAERVNGGDFRSYFVNEDGVDAETTACGQGFSGELEEDSLYMSELSIAWPEHQMQAAGGIFRFPEKGGDTNAPQDR